MQPIFDTANLSDAQDAGRIDPDHINSDDRLRVFFDRGHLELIKGAGRESVLIEVTPDEWSAIRFIVSQARGGNSTPKFAESELMA